MIIGTHPAPHHADESLAIVVLIYFFVLRNGEFEIVESRDPEQLKMCDIMVDVGGEYDDERRFDHHQKDDAPEPRQNGVPYSSAGLVWKKFGRQIAGSDEAWKLMDETFFQKVDAIDNGKQEFGEHYITKLIDKMNPNWNEENVTPTFVDMIDMAAKVFRRELAAAEAVVAARVAMEKAAKEADSIIVLDHCFPWDEEGSPVMESKALYVVFPSNGEWAAFVIPQGMTKELRFKARKDFPEGWGGLRNSDLASVTGVTDAVFCHKGLFCAYAKTKEGAVQLAQLAQLAANS